MDNRFPDRYAAQRLLGASSRRAAIAGAFGFLAAGFAGPEAMARNTRNRRRNRNINRSKENSISIPGEPGQPGEPGEPQED